MKIIKILAIHALLVSGLAFAMESPRFGVEKMDKDSKEFVLKVLADKELELDQSLDFEIVCLFLVSKHRQKLERLHLSLLKKEKSRNAALEQLHELRKKRQSEFEQEQREERALEKLQALGIASANIQLCNVELKQQQREERVLEKLQKLGIASVNIQLYRE